MGPNKNQRKEIEWWNSSQEEPRGPRSGKIRNLEFAGRCLVFPVLGSPQPPTGSFPGLFSWAGALSYLGVPLFSIVVLVHLKHQRALVCFFSCVLFNLGALSLVFSCGDGSSQISTGSFCRFLFLCWCFSSGLGALSLAGSFPALYSWCKRPEYLPKPHGRCCRMIKNTQPHADEMRLEDWIWTEMDFCCYSNRIKTGWLGFPSML